LGDLNLELHCDVTPRTCENWLALAEAGYYDDTPFHRLIKHFMVQGGDPTGTGTGGCSIWGPTFADEFDARLSHDGRGVVSMANAGPNTNGSQFFITFKSARHLDRKHTIFGKIVGGKDVSRLGGDWFYVASRPLLACFVCRETNELSHREAKQYQCPAEIYIYTCFAKKNARNQGTSLQWMFADVFIMFFRCLLQVSKR
jgi:cyclophilin family peptidyl-prolyl cis-trans isomerase